MDGLYHPLGLPSPETTYKSHEDATLYLDARLDRRRSWGARKGSVIGCLWCSSLVPYIFPTSITCHLMRGISGLLAIGGLRDREGGGIILSEGSVDSRV